MSSWIKNDAAQTWGQRSRSRFGDVTCTPDLALFAAGYFARIVYPISDRAWTNTLDLRAAGLGMKFHLAGPNIVVAGSASIRGCTSTTRPSGGKTRRRSRASWGASPSAGNGAHRATGRSASRASCCSAGWRGEILPAPQPAPYIARGFALPVLGRVRRGLRGGRRRERAQLRAPPHDNFFLNASAGLGKLWLTGGEVDSDNNISGGSRTLALSAGYAITPSLVLFGAFFEVFAPNPANAIQPLADLEVHGVGPGVRYYLSSFHIFVEGALPVSRIGFHRSGTRGMTGMAPTRSARLAPHAARRDRLGEMGLRQLGTGVAPPRASSGGRRRRSADRRVRPVVHGSRVSR